MLAVDDLVDAIVRAAYSDVAGETFNVGAEEFGTVRSDLEALIAHAGTRSRLRPVPARPAELVLRALELARVSPLVEWHYKTASRDSYVDVTKAITKLGWHATKSNVETLIEKSHFERAFQSTMTTSSLPNEIRYERASIASSADNCRVSARRI